jgi:hypothetical protein
MKPLLAGNSFRIRSRFALFLDLSETERICLLALLLLLIAWDLPLIRRHMACSEESQNYPDSFEDETAAEYEEKNIWKRRV